MVIGMFGCYSQWLQTYEVRIHPWRELQKLQPNPGIVNLEEEQDSFQLLWTPDHATLFNELKDDLINNMILTRPNPTRRFYVRTDWSKTSFGAVLLQASDDAASRAAEAAEDAGGPCLLNKINGGLHLRPIAFISRSK